MSSRGGRICPDIFALCWPTRRPESRRSQLNAQEGGEQPPYGPRRVGPPGPAYEQQSRRSWPGARPPRPPREPRGGRIDLLIGIPLGIVLGIAIVTAFVFLGSEGTIDAPRLSGVNGNAARATGAGGPGAQNPGPGNPAPQQPAKQGITEVRIIGGLPLEGSGGAKIRGRSHQPVRSRVASD